VPTMTALLVKESVNQTVDQMGFSNAMAACFSIHQLNHSHWAEIHDDNAAIADVRDGIPHWKDAPPIRASKRDQVVFEG
jgi:enoyl-CoA hydratase